MTQLALDVDAHRRIDVTLDRLNEVFEGLTSEQQTQLGRERYWSIVVMVARLRAMERGEETVSPTLVATMADAYDRVVQPGVGHPVDALLRTFKAVYGDDATDRAT